MSDEDQRNDPEYLHTEPCPSGEGIHAVGVLADGSTVDMGHGEYVDDGQSMLPGNTYYQVDTRDGRVVDAYRVPGGPAKVSSPAFRDGWDRIFGKDKTVGEA